MNASRYLIKRAMDEVDEAMDADRAQRRTALKTILAGSALGAAAGAGIGYGGVRTARNIIAPKLEAAATELRSPRLARMGAGLGAAGIGIPVAAGLAIGESGRARYYKMLREKLTGVKKESKE